jgi:hypothetical protein
VKNFIINYINKISWRKHKMTDENQVVETVQTVVTHPIYAEFTKSEIPKLAQKKLELSHIAKLNGLKLEHIFQRHAHNFWLSHLDAILRHHRSQHGQTFLPHPLPSGVRKMTAEMLTQKHQNKVESAYQKLKAKHSKLESKVKSAVKKRV